MSLTDNSSVITAIGNDYGYEQVFVKQLEACLGSGDLLVSISASGNSLNILKAVEYTKENSGTTIGLTGFDSWDMNNMIHYFLQFPTVKTS
jgi:D-sedoheptulose 7-phosphate isomerase